MVTGGWWVTLRKGLGVCHLYCCLAVSSAPPPSSSTTATPKHAMTKNQRKKLKKKLKKAAKQQESDLNSAEMAKADGKESVIFNHQDNSISEVAKGLPQSLGVTVC